MQAALLPLLLLLALASPCHAGSPQATAGAGMQPQDSALPQGQGWLDMLRGVLTLPLTDALRLHARLGWHESGGQDPGRTANLAPAFVRSGWRPGPDRVGEGLDADRGREPWLRAGLRWAAFADRLVLDSNLGVKASGQHPVTLSLGLKIAL